jgi:hypothetical protein
VKKSTFFHARITFFHAGRCSVKKSNSSVKKSNFSVKKRLLFTLVSMKKSRFGKEKIFSSAQLIKRVVGGMLSQR